MPLSPKRSPDGNRHHAAQVEMFTAFHPIGACALNRRAAPQRRARVEDIAGFTGSSRHIPPMMRSEEQWPVPMPGNTPGRKWSGPPTGKYLDGTCDTSSITQISGNLAHLFVDWSGRRHPATGNGWLLNDQVLLRSRSRRALPVPRYGGRPLPHIPPGRVIAQEACSGLCRLGSNITK